MRGGRGQGRARRGGGAMHRPGEEGATYAVLVDHVQNDRELPGVRAVGDQDLTADLDKARVHLNETQGTQGSAGVRKGHGCEIDLGGRSTCMRWMGRAMQPMIGRWSGPASIHPSIRPDHPARACVRALMPARPATNAAQGCNAWPCLTSSPSSNGSALHPRPSPNPSSTESIPSIHPSRAATARPKGEERASECFPQPLRDADAGAGSGDAPSNGAGRARHSPSSAS